MITFLNGFGCLGQFWPSVLSLHSVFCQVLHEGFCFVAFIFVLHQAVAEIFFFFLNMFLVFFPAGSYVIVQIIKLHN